MDTTTMGNFDENKIRRAGDGKFTTKGYSEAADGTDADLGPSMGAVLAAGLKVIGRERMVQHFHTASITPGALVDLDTTGGIIRGTLTREGNDYIVTDDQGERTEVYSQLNNNLTPAHVLSLQYVHADRSGAELTEQQRDYALGALGPHVTPAEQREFVDAMDAYGDDEAGGEMAYDEWKHRFEQRDLRAAAEKLGQDISGHPRYLNPADPDHDDRPDAHADATEEQAARLWGQAQAAEDDPWYYDGDGSRAEAIEYARAVLATPPQGIVNPGFEYAIAAAAAARTVTGNDGATYLTTGEGMDQIAYRVPRFTKGAADSSHAVHPDPKAGITSSQLGDMYDWARGQDRASAVGKRVREDIEDAIAVGYLPSNLIYQVQSKGKLGIEADVTVRITGLSEQHCKDSERTDRWGDPTVRPGVTALEKRVQDMVDRYASHTVNYDTDYHRHTLHSYAYVDPRG